MKRSRALLIVSASLFLAWIGYLALLAFTTTPPTVLSRPQFLVADLYVVADIPADVHRPGKPGNPLTIKKVVWSKVPEDGQRTQVVVGWLAPRRFTPPGWGEPGEYVLALSRTPDADVFVVTPLPHSPGFHGAAGRIYPATYQTLEQLEMLAREFHP